jgi:hypothetical protein
VPCDNGERQGGPSAARSLTQPVGTLHRGQNAGGRTTEGLRISIGLSVRDFKGGFVSGLWLPFPLSLSPKLKRHNPSEVWPQNPDSPLARPC